MSKPLPKIVVSGRHIASGVRRSKTLCAVAMAINESGFGPAEVEMDHIRGGATVFRTPEHVAENILAIDEGRDVQAFEFQWPVPRKVILT